MITKIAKQTKSPLPYVEKLFAEIGASLIKEGCPEDDPRFYPYLIRRIRKRLKIEESPTYKTFKQFFKEN